MLIRRSNRPSSQNLNNASLCFLPSRQMKSFRGQLQKLQPLGLAPTCKLLDQIATSQQENVLINDQDCQCDIFVFINSCMSFIFLGILSQILGAYQSLLKLNVYEGKGKFKKCIGQEIRSETEEKITRKLQQGKKEILRKEDIPFLCWTR